MLRPTLAVFLVAFLPFLVVGAAEGQPTRTAEVFYLKFGQGASDLSGDAGTETGIRDLVDSQKFAGDGLQYAFALEVGYKFSRSSSLGIGYQLGSYYHPDDEGLEAGNRYLHTFQILARHKLGARRWRVVPYVDIGVNASSGIEKIGVGPTAGIGLSVAVDNRMSIFLESRLNISFPNQTADTDLSASPTRGVSPLFSEKVPFDVLSTLPSLGVEIDLR